MSKYKTLKLRIKVNEGYKNSAYKDSLGYFTIGYGHLVKKNEKKLLLSTLTKQALEKIFQNDFNKALSDYNKFYEKENYKRNIKEVLIEMIFQLGIKGQLKFKKMNKYILKNELFMAAFEMKNSIWYLQTPKRVNILINILLKKNYE